MNRLHADLPGPLGVSGGQAGEVGQASRTVHPFQRVEQGLGAWRRPQDRVAGPPVEGVIEDRAQGRRAEATQQVSTGLLQRVPGHAGMRQGNWSSMGTMKRRSRNRVASFAGGLGDEQAGMTGRAVQEVGGCLRQPFGAQRV